MTTFNFREPGEFGDGATMTPTTIGANELRAILPCPFCGEVKRVWPQNGNIGSYEKGWHQLIWCENCGATSREWPTEAEAIAAWNRRKDGLGTVSVKPLTFNKYEEAKGASAKYTVYESGGGLWNSVCYPYEDSHFRLAEGVTHSEAVSSCNSDFETRVKSCLTSTGVEAGK